MGRLLQLVLGCAVNCEKKHDYIYQIMQMEESVQHVVMKAIQEVRDDFFYNNHFCGHIQEFISIVMDFNRTRNHIFCSASDRNRIFFAFSA